jgi:hypothetical protein
MLITHCLCTIVVLAATAAAQQSTCTPTLSVPLFLDPNGLVSLQQSKNTADGTFTMRITYGGSPSWIGVGINLDGRANMTPTQAVIGRVQEDSSETSVWKYRLASDDEDASGVLRLSDDLQVDLTKTSFTQDFEAQETVLEFTHPLADVAGSIIVTDESFWVFAVGNPDNAWTGRHEIHGGFQLPLTDSCLQQGGEDGSSSSSANEGISLIGTEKEGESLYLAHGICMAVAWGVFAPMAIGVSFARNTAYLQQNANWLKLHFYLNIAVVLITTIGFALAVAAAGQNSVNRHFRDNAHTKGGLAVFLLVFVQAFMGYFRPAAGSKQKTPSDDTSDPAKEAEADGEETTHEITQSIHSVVDKSCDVKDKAPREQPSVRDVPQKSLVRRSWEIGHRLLALILVGLAWYNCTSGIQLHLLYFGGDEDNGASSQGLWMGVFWGVTALISVTFLAMGAWQRRTS